MRGKGINYDTGFSPGGRNSREHFDAGTVRAEMRVIARELRCTAVRISGGDPGRLSTAGELAAAEGLEVWFAPFPSELTTDQLAPLFADCADRAEHLRRAGANVVLVTGRETGGAGSARRTCRRAGSRPRTGSARNPSRGPRSRRTGADARRGRRSRRTAA